MHVPKIANSRQPVVPQIYFTGLKLKIFLTKLIPIKSNCYFCKFYDVTVRKQLKILYLITIHKKYCNSKEMLCDDIKNLLSIVGISSLLACFTNYVN